MTPEVLREHLQDLRDSSFNWLLRSTYAVVVGIVLEAPEVFHETRAAFKERTISDVAMRWIKLFSLFGWLLIVVGVLGEGVFEAIVSNADGRIQILERSRVIELGKQADEASGKIKKALDDSNTATTKSTNAIKSAGAAASSSGNALLAARRATFAASSALGSARRAQKEADAFEKDIASAKKQATEAEEHLAEALQRALEAKLALDQFKAPKSISQLQQASITSQISSFGSIRIDVIIVGDGPEIARMANQIILLVKLAGWTLGNVAKAVGGPAFSGVLIGTHLGSSPDTLAAANSLRTALQGAGIMTRNFSPQFDDDLPFPLSGNWVTTNTAPIRIMIGPKP